MASKLDKIFAPYADRESISKAELNSIRGAIMALLDPRKKPPPTQTQVEQFVVENGYPRELGAHVYAYYNEPNDKGERWTDGQGKPVINWKKKIRGVWLTEQNRQKYGKQQQYKQGGNNSNTVGDKIANIIAANERLYPSS